MEELPKLKNWTQDVSKMMDTLVHARTCQAIIPFWNDREFTLFNHIHAPPGVYYE